jgi:multiple sugar transport system permease protein
VDVFLKARRQPKPEVAADSLKPRRQFKPSQILTVTAYFFLTLWAFLCLFPLYWMIKNSFEPNKLIGLWPPAVLPNWDQLTFSNYINLMHRFPLVRWFLNNLVVAVIRTAGAIFFGSLAGYAFAKLHFFGREVIFWILMPVLMVPGFILIIPQYQLIYSLGWIDTYWALIVPGLTGGVWAMFLMRQFMHTIPNELIECARIDGAGEFLIFRAVVAPLAVPGMAVLGIFEFIGNWNNFLYPLIVTSDKLMRTLPVGLSVLASPADTGQVVPIGEIMAGGAIAAIPMIIVFLFFQRYFLKGITVGAIKG